MVLLLYSWCCLQLLQLLHYFLDFILHYTFSCQIALYVMLTQDRGPRSKIKSTCALELYVVYTQVYYIN